MAIFSVLGLAVPQSLSLLTFLLPDGIFAVVGLLLSAILMNFAIAGSLRKKSYKTAFGIGGGILVIVAFIGFMEPTYYHMLSQYIRPANVLMLLLSGIGYLIAALEYNRPSLLEELGLGSITKMYREYSWKLVLGFKLPHKSEGTLTHHASKARQT